MDRGQKTIYVLTRVYRRGSNTQWETVDSLAYGLVHFVRLHFELEYSRVAVAFTSTSSSLQTFIFKTQSFTSFQN